MRSVDVVKRVIDAFNRRDVDAVAAGFAGDVELDWSRSRAPTAGRYAGHAGLRELIGEYWEVFHRVRFVPEELIEVGPHIVVVPNRTSLRGRDGIEVFTESTYVFTVRDRRVSAFALYHDLGEALDEQGEPDYAAAP
jgi:ketosteroid isomerase-like protein